MDNKEIEALEDKLVEYSKRIKELKKSNRNWRRKAQRLRKELKEAKENGVS